MDASFTQHEINIRNSFADTNELLNLVNDRIVELHQTVLTRLDLLMTTGQDTLVSAARPGDKVKR
jgi:hypothetical protein